ncbi:MAG: M23 family metallopeptidase [Mariprofundaceae bacterium]|nr:M23 family metallopeptidase [Mariprofundaceae bacterium]
MTGTCVFIASLFRAFLVLIILNIALGTQYVTAHEWHTIQGDVVRVDATLTGQHVSLHCFGKNWPVKMVSKDHWIGWIGVDLGQKPGNYSLRWVSAGQKESGHLHISQGKFRVSRIEVKKKMAVFDAKALARIRADQAAIKKTYVMQVNATPDISITEHPVHGPVSTPFGARRYVNGKPRSPHSGLDIAAPEGTPIINPLAGRVLLAESMFLNGNTIVIGHGRGLVMVYSHLKSLHVHKGAWIKAGETIGEVGQTGRATGPHLHWGVRFNGARINPDSLLVHAGGLAMRLVLLIRS